MKVTLYFFIPILLSSCRSYEPEHRALRWGHGGGAQGGGNMMGGGNQGGGGGGNMGMGGNRGTMSLIHNLVDHHDDIERDVEETDDGVVTYTWSEDSQVSDWLKRHVAQMKRLVHGNQGRRIRNWDPLFRAIFDHRNEMVMEEDYLDSGVRVWNNGTTDCGISLAQLHAEAVSAFVKRGWAEVQNSHAAPEEC